MNAILPAAIDTPMYREFNDTEDKQKWLANLHALKRAGQAGRVAKSVLYLASDDSAFVTGTAHLIDGGILGHAHLRTRDGDHRAAASITARWLASKSRNAIQRICATVLPGDSPGTSAGSNGAEQHATSHRR